jgi:UDP-glucose 4-epimerase
MKCLVTGAAGFVGSSISDRLISRGDTVIGVDCFLDYYPRWVKEENLKGARSHKNFEFIEGDLLNLDIQKLLQRVDVVFHQAGQAGVRASWGEYFKTYTDNNILATQRLLEGARALKNPPKIVYASSSSVYGDAESYPTHERMVPAPVSPYGVTKLAAEHLVSLYASQFGLNTVSLRYFTVFGPRQRPDMAFTRFCYKALNKIEIPIFGDGSQSRDFTFISDIVEANLLAAEHGGNGRVFNIGGGTNATVNDVLTILRKLTGELQVRYSEKMVGEAKKTAADTTAARRDLQFSPKVSLEQGIEAQVNWMKEILARGLSYPVS